MNGTAEEKVQWNEKEGEGALSKLNAGLVRRERKRTLVVSGNWES